jgi:GNAT superfamily N-acetyltransferase
MRAASTARVTFQRENLENFLDDARPLLERHWAEIAEYGDIALDPDVDRYQTLENAGCLRIYTLRLDHRLIGYAVFLLSAHLHYKSSTHAYGDVLFIDPEHRRGLLATRLIEYTETELRKDGVQVVHHHVKVQHPALGVVLGRMGYRHVEQNFQRRLDR